MKAMLLAGLACIYNRNYLKTNTQRDLHHMNLICHRASASGDDLGLVRIPRESRQKQGPKGSFLNIADGR